MTQIQLNISTNSTAQQEEIIAQLQEIGFDGFEEIETTNTLLAYINENLYNEDLVKEVLKPYQLTFTQQAIKPQNWNAIWESNFNAIQVDDAVGIRANFHSPIKNVKHEIVITPKMSFGTGHHNTTYMVMQLMATINFKNKTVYDFGTGTGILAIYAAKLGATQILAVDNDDWCIENSLENCENNACSFIQIKKVTTAKMEEQFDVVLANVNLNIIHDNLDYLAQSVAPKGSLIVSGIVVEDEQQVTNWFVNLGFTHTKTLNKDAAMWIAMQFEKA